MAVKNREEMIAEMETLLSAAESGPLTPDDVSRFQDIVQCVRDYVPEFEAGDVDDDYAIEEGGEGMEAAMPSEPPDLAAIVGAADAEIEPSPKRPPMLPPYKRRDGR